MRKLLIIFLCLLLCFSIVGCSVNDSFDSSKSQEIESEQVLENKELSDEKLAEIVAKHLGVPDEMDIEYSVSEMFYWDSAERYFKNVDFTQTGLKVAGASVDPYTGELLRNIWQYDSLE